jgi:hypothetical protein
MLRLFLSCIALAVVCPGAAAQKVTVRENDHTNETGLSWGGRWRALGLSAPRSEAWTGVGFRLLNLGVETTVNLAVYEQHAQLPGPGALLGTGLATVPASGAHVWVHGRFDAPVPVVGGRFYYVALELPSVEVRALFAFSGEVSRHWWLRSSAGTWWTNANDPDFVRLRIYAGTHAGAAVHYGAGQGGAGGPPVLRVSGFANTTNPLHMQVIGLPAGSAAVFFLGPRAAIPFPLFPVLVDPWSSIVAAAVTSPHATGRAAWAEAERTIPDDQSLEGVKLAIQAAALDPAAPFGISATDAVELTFGH